MITNTQMRKLIDEAAKEAAILSHEFFGKKIAASKAYEMIFDSNAFDDLLVVRPGEFRNDYDRYFRLIEEKNSFMMIEVAQRS